MTDLVKRYTQHAMPLIFEILINANDIPKKWQKCLIYKRNWLISESRLSGREVLKTEVAKRRKLQRLDRIKGQ